MIDHQIDEETILIDEISDEAVEAAAGVALGGLPTIMDRTYCFACPSGDCAKLIEAKAGTLLRNALCVADFRYIKQRLTCVVN